MPELICHNCGESAVGTALNGNPYCHRRDCIDWKLERQRARDQRARAERSILFANFHHISGQLASRSATAVNTQEAMLAALSGRDRKEAA